MASARRVLLGGQPRLAHEVQRRACRRELAEDGGVAVERGEDERGLAVRVPPVRVRVRARARARLGLGLGLGSGLGLG